LILPTNSDAAVRSSDISGMLRQAATQSGTELFAAYGINLVPTGKNMEADATVTIGFLSVAGFSGPNFSGFVVLGTTEATLRRSNSTESAASDWMAELGNQLLGRLKNRLLRAGIPIYRVPPAVMSGSAPSLFYARGGVKPVRLNDHGDTVFIWTEFEPSFEPSEVAFSPDTGVLAEGEVLLF
jgi:hypothetical protein